MFWQWVRVWSTKQRFCVGVCCPVNVYKKCSKNLVQNSGILPSIRRVTYWTTDSFFFIHGKKKIQHFVHVCEPFESLKDFSFSPFFLQIPFNFLRCERKTLKVVLDLISQWPKSNHKTFQKSDCEVCISQPIISQRWCSKNWVLNSRQLSANYKKAQLGMLFC